MQHFIARPVGLEECKKVIAAMRASIEEEIAAEMTESYVVRSAFTITEFRPFESDVVIISSDTLSLSYTGSE